MPLVHIKYKSAIKADTLRSLIPTVNTTVAEQLRCDDKPEGFLVTPQMVKIRFSSANELDSQMPDIFIEVEGRAFPSRLGNQEEFAAVLSEALAPLLPESISYGVWFKLHVAGWKAGKGTQSK